MSVTKILECTIKEYGYETILLLATCAATLITQADGVLYPTLDSYLDIINKCMGEEPANQSNIE